MKRRTFLKLVGVGAIGSIVSPASLPAAFASEGDAPVNVVPFTPELASDLAVNFASSMEPGVKILTDAVITYYDITGASQGYVVELSSAGESFGYVVFDITYEGLISEFSIGADAALSPASSTSDTGVSTFSTQEKKLYKTDDFDYCSIDLETMQGMNNLGEYVNAEEAGIVEDPLISTYDWDDMFVSEMDAGTNYSLSGFQMVRLYKNWPQKTYEQESGRYCCMVSAAYTGASIYGWVGDLGSLRDVYLELWNLIGVNTTSTSGGIIYGGADLISTGRGITNFLANRGTYRSFRHTVFADYESFRTCVSRNECSILGGSSHGVAIVGYFNLTRKSDGWKMPALCVCDGWNPGNRILNFQPSMLSNPQAIYFS